MVIDDPKDIFTQTLIKFGARVRYLRVHKGWSQEDLAQHSGLHRTYIGSIERGEQNISLKNIMRIALAFNLPLQELLNLEDKE